MRGLIGSELLKLRTLPTWWIAGAAMAAVAVLLALWNSWQAHTFMQPFEDYLAGAILTPREDMSAEQVGTMRDLWETQSAPGRIAATLYTSGQTLGLLLAGVLAILLVTNEYQYRTLTATFLAAPRRGRVVTAKLVVVLISSAGLWLAATLGSLLVGGIFLTSQGAGLGLGSADVLGAVLLNLAAYLVWGVFGFGLGVLIRSQTAATVTAAVLYFLSSVVVAFAFQVVHDLVLEENWVLQAQVLLPGVASQIMTTPGELFAGAPAPWTGAAVLVAYSLAGGLTGTLLLLRRDVT
ncbi:ABC transporter permease subunit [Streptomyces sp. NBC_01005]|uniref:ABC transporter permease subunit n=1 Tax=unclassified Streptomyces TaxID=2593676 RepID=UPI003867723D|nr:ABC transporter permease subunit [Streptomyces sp. NBC_01005]WTC95698.1 ABC transporter permease subunit [Streptomyces sp. NBC_01650]